MANAIYQQEGTPKVFKPTGGDAALGAGTLANGAGRISARLDLGAAPRPWRYRWRARVRCGAAPSVGASLRVYLAPSNGTDTDGNFGTTDAAVANEDLFANLLPTGAVLADTASAAQYFIASGLVELADRYVSVGVWNGLGQALNTCEVTLTPVYDEVQ